MPTASASQLTISALYPDLWFQHLPEVCRYLAAGCVGNLVFFKIDQALYTSIILPLSKDMPKFFQKNKESVSFFLANLIQISLRHFINAVLVFGLHTIVTKDKYMQTLILTYSSYSLSLFGTTIANAMLIQQGVPKAIAFWGTIYGFGVINFFLLRYLIAGKGGDSRVGDETKVDGVQKKMNHRSAEARRGVFRRMRGGQQISSYEDMIRGELSHVIFGRKADPMLEIVKATGMK